MRVFDGDSVSKKIDTNMSVDGLNGSKNRRKEEHRLIEGKEHIFRGIYGFFLTASTLCRTYFNIAIRWLPFLPNRDRLFECIA